LWPLKKNSPLEKPPRIYPHVIDINIQHAPARDEYTGNYLYVLSYNNEENRKIITEVSKKARELDERLGTNIFPKNRS